MLTALREGGQLALSFNPLTSLLGSMLVAVLLTRARSTFTTVISWSVLAGIWVVGDAVLRTLPAEKAGAATTWPAFTAFALGAAGSFCLGYFLPAWSGSFVGRRVTFGTGWASAAVIAASTSAAVGALAERWAI